MKQVVVISGKGGTGKTMLSAAFATLAENIVAADCDVEASNLYLILTPTDKFSEKVLTGQKAVIDYEKCSGCGICESYCRFDAISAINGIVTVSETDCDGCILCSRVCPHKAITMRHSEDSRWFSGQYRNGYMVHARLEPGGENSGKLVNIVREEAKKCAEKNNSELIIIDGPPGTGCPAISALTGTDEAVIVTEPSRSGFHDLKRILEVTDSFNIRSHVVINKYDLNPEIASEIEEWCLANKKTLAGRLPFDKNVVNAMINAESITEYSPGSEISRAVRDIFRSLT